MALLDQLYPWLVSALGGFIGAALLLPTKLGEAIIQYRVGKTLETFKALQAKELEGIKADLQHVNDRGKRSNEMEFQAIQLVWRTFVKAWLSTNTCISQRMSLPDFERMNEEEVKAFANGSGLSAQEQTSLLRAHDKAKEYILICSWKSVVEAGSDIYQARLTLREQRIFMPPALTEEFGKLIEEMSGAQVERRLSLEHPNIPSYQFGKAQADWMMNSTKIFEEMARSANARLFRDERRHEPN